VLEDKDLISIQQARQLARQASEALASLKALNQEQVDAVVAAMALAAEQEAQRLAEMAVEETGYGNVRDKTLKNLFSAVDVHRYIKDLKTCGVIAENKARKVVDIAVPAGVIAAIIPTTNPTSTTIFKVLCALKGRNAVVLSPHPNALNCTVETAGILYQAARGAGAPEHCINWMTDVTLEGTRELMSHPETNLIRVGPGNVPAFIERTANVAKAVRDVIAGKTFDFGVLCSSEQALVYDRSIEDKVMEELGRNNAYLAEGSELERLERLLQNSRGRLNTAVVGKSPQVIAQMAGFSVGHEVSCLVGRAGGGGTRTSIVDGKTVPCPGFVRSGRVGGRL
jgi:acyl-CoA reductase-like NAD-dependent aldehyde dehydrogenase